MKIFNAWWKLFVEDIPLVAAFFHLNLKKFITSPEV